MVNFSTPPGLEGLFDLDRKGVDIRPTLLRVLTDQYLRSPCTSPDEERHYTELAMRLIDETDIATRAAVSVRLAPHACAPRSIMLQLARDVLEVAEPVLLHSPVPHARGLRGDRRRNAASLCRHPRPARQAVRAAPAPAPAAVASTPTGAHRAGRADNRTAEPRTPTPATAPAADRRAGDDADARELCELFFAAGSAERRLILLNLDYARLAGA